MTARTFEVARGRIIELAIRAIDSDPVTCDLFIAYYQGVIQADAALEAHLTKSAVDANNTIATFTNYGLDSSRVLTGVTTTITAGEHWCTSATETITAAGGALNNTITRAVLYYAADISSTTTAIPLCHYTFSVNTSGIDLSFEPGTSGLYRTG
jgi:hypothetical protein